MSLVDGYQVSTRKKAIQKVELDLLKQLISVCEKHGIRYFVDAGTFLGAVRHKGFIPWDDDIDVGFLRDDFNKLLKVGPKEFRHPYFFQSYLSQNQALYSFCRLRNSNTTGIIMAKNLLVPGFNQGIFIDLVCFDAYPTDAVKYKKYVSRVRRLWHVWRLTNIPLSHGRRFRRSVALTMRFFRINDMLFWAIQKAFGRFKDKAGDGYCFGEIEPHIFDGAFPRYWYRREEIERCDLIRFEDIDVVAPFNIDYLERTYGNWHQYPPIAEREQHASSVVFDPYVAFADYYANHPDEFPGLS